MDFLTFLSIVLPAVLNSWPLVVLFVLVRYRNSIEKLTDRITSATWKDLSIVFWKQDLPQLPPLRELNVIDTVSLGGTCRTSARLLGATLSFQNDKYSAYYSQGSQSWSPTNLRPTDKPPGTFIT
jgi:hypothetical protein